MCCEFVMARADFCMSGHVANVYALGWSTYLDPYVWHIMTPYPARFLDVSSVTRHLVGLYTHIGIVCSGGMCWFAI